MRQITALSIMLLSCAVSYACGAAVMSIDLGSEWVKVSRVYLFKCFARQVDLVTITCFLLFNRLELFHLAYQWK